MGMGIKNKILIAIQGLAYYMRPQNTFEKVKKKNILILIDSVGIGDIVLQLSALHNLNKFMKNKSEYKLYLAANTIICNFLRNIESTFDMELIEVDFSIENKQNFYIFKSNYCKINNNYYDYIISFDNLGGYIKTIIIGLKYGEIIFSENQFSRKLIAKDFVFRLFLKNVNFVKIDHSVQSLTHKSLICKKVLYEVLKCLSNKNEFIDEYSEYEIPVLYQKNKIENNYCVITAGIAKGHDCPYRGWNIEKFAHVANFILANTDLIICLSGTNDDEVANSELYSMIKNKRRVINLTAKTSFDEWVEVLRNAEFIFGNDSGYIHLASMLRTKSFVIAGFWNYGRFLPYGDDVEVCAKPIDIRIDKPKCALCSIIKHNCMEKVACDKKVLKDGIYKCIDDITSEMAIEAVKSHYISPKG